MTGVASDWVLAEINLVVRFNRQNHPHHFTSLVLYGLVITFPNPLRASGSRIFALVDVAVIALDAERDGDKIHQQKQLRFRQAFEYLNVFSRLIDCLIDLRSLE